jgi:hypothetical protein
MIQVTADLKKVDSLYRDLLLAAIKHIPIVLHSQEFLEALKDEFESSNGLEGELSEWKDKTAGQVLAHMLLSDWHLILATYYTWRNTVGFGYPNDPTIYLNTKFLSGDMVDDLEDLCDIGSNLVHEHGHDLGFDHDHAATARRENSICYILNRAYEKAFRKIYKLDELEEEPEVVYVLPWWRRILPWNWRK